MSRRPSHILLLGRKGIVIEDVQAQLDIPGLTIHGGTNLHDVREAMATYPIDTVIMGAGLELGD